MIDINHRIKIFSELGSFFGQFSGETEKYHHLNNAFYEKMRGAMKRAEAKNAWFTQESLERVFSAWAEELTVSKLTAWMAKYPDFQEPKHPKRVAMIMAGNIPLVGFHDFLTGLILGHTVLAKMSSDDAALFPVIKEILVELHPDFAERIELVEKIEKPDAVIATGSDNSARYFESYFGKYPHIIRKNRTSVALISGDETDEELKRLGNDLFTYYGLGCRNVSKIYIPTGYDLNKIFGQLVGFGEVGNHFKYNNNYEYYRTIYMLNKVKFLENGFVIFRENESLHTPISVVHYEYYSALTEVKRHLQEKVIEIQCVVGKGDDRISFGQSQQPALWDYADGVDTVRFLLDC